MEQNIQLRMHAGCGAYIQGTNVLSQIGALLQERGVSKPLLIAGRTAFSKAGEALLEGLSGCGMAAETVIYTAPCVVEDVRALCEKARRDERDCIIGVGGGKVLDLSKAVAEFASMPVFTVPTIAATCAATTPLSAMYGYDGKYVKNLYHRHSVAGVIADLNILAAAPPRYLASGIADAFAKSCEYSAFREAMDYETSDFGRFMGHRLALSSDELLLKLGEQAYRDNEQGIVSRAFCDAVSCVIPVIGIVSGMGAYAASGGARFAMAHAFNELIRGRYVSDVNRWLHGELVGVGILCQMQANGMPEAELERHRSLFRSLNLPCSLSDVGMDVSQAAIELFVDELMEMRQIDPLLRDRVQTAVESVR